MNKTAKLFPGRWEKNHVYRVIATGAPYIIFFFLNTEVFYLFVKCLQHISK